MWWIVVLVVVVVVAAVTLVTLPMRASTRRNRGHGDPSRPARRSHGTAP